MGWDFIAPGMALLTVFVVLPTVGGIVLSAFRMDGIGPTTFAGLDNYRRLAGDQVAWLSLWHTLLYVLLTLPLGLALALGIALALHQKWFIGRSLVRSLYFMPNVTSTVSVAFVWQWLLNPEYGLVNAMLRRFHGPTYGWLSDPNLAMPSVAIVGIWQGLGFSILVFLSGLRAIPAELYEAACLDGANAVQQFRHVTCSLLTPTLMFLTIMGVIGGFQVFQSVYVMTGGGPVDRTQVFLYYLWHQAFQNLQLGYACSMAVLLFAIMLGLTLLQWRFYSKRMGVWQ